MSRLDDLIADLCPDGVEYQKLSSLVSRTSNINWTAAEGQEFRYIDLTSVDRDTHQIQISEIITSENAPSRAQQIVQEGDVLFGTTRPMLKRFCHVPLEFDGQIASTGYCVLRADHSRLLSRFLFHVLGSHEFYTFVDANQRGASYPAIPDSVVKQFRIPVPPLEVQREIVSILDTFSELEARRMQYAHYRDGLLSFDRGVRDVALSEVVEFINGKPHERLVSEDGTVALLTSRSISTDGKKARYVEPDKVLTPAKVGDVSLVMSDLPNGRALARTFYVDEEGRFAANQRVCLLRVRSAHEIVPRFLHHVMDRNRQLLAYDNGTDQTHLKKGQILTMRCSVPPLAEQERIVGILDKFDAMVNDLSIGLPAELEARRKQYEHYRDRLLTFEEAPA